MCVCTISVHLARRATANGKPLRHNIYSKHRFPRKSTQSHVSFISRNEFKCVEKEFFRFYVIQQWRTHLLCDQIVEVWPPNSIQFDVHYKDSKIIGLFKAPVLWTSVRYKTQYPLLFQIFVCVDYVCRRIEIEIKSKRSEARQMFM